MKMVLLVLDSLIERLMKTERFERGWFEREALELKKKGRTNAS
jgi:hypothetical protein